MVASNELRKYCLLEIYYNALGTMKGVVKMKLFGDFGSSIIRDQTPSKYERKNLERVVRNVSETAGDVLEFMNNIEDSKENLEEAINPTSRFKRAWVGMTVAEAKATLEKGDHIKVMRTVYSHHGIYIGKGQVIEYNDGVVQESSLKSFADGDSIICVYEPSDYTKNEIVQRAKSRLGESDYNLAWNNCENFATWCRCGGEL